MGKLAKVKQICYLDIVTYIDITRHLDIIWYFIITRYVSKSIKLEIKDKSLKK